MRAEGGAGANADAVPSKSAFSGLNPEGAGRVNFFRRKALLNKKWVQWGAIGAVALLFTVIVGAVLLFAPKSRGTDYIEIYITDVPGDFDEVKLRVGGVYVGTQGHPLNVHVPEFNILAHQGPGSALKLASGHIPHGNHSQVFVVFSRAEGLLDDKWRLIPIPKTMLEVRTGLDFAETRAGAVLLDLDMDRSLVLTERGFTFQPRVGTVYLHDYEQKESDSGKNPGVDLSKDGFKSDPTVSEPDQENKSPPPKFGGPTSISRSASSVSRSGTPGASDVCRAACSSGSQSVGPADDPVDPEEEPVDDPVSEPNGETSPVPNLGPSFYDPNCDETDASCEASKKIWTAAGDAGEIVNWIVTFHPDRVTPSLDDANYTIGSAGEQFHKATESVMSPEEIQEFADLITAKGGSVLFNFRSSRSMSASMTPDQAKSLAEEDPVKYIHEDLPAMLTSFESAKEVIQLNDLPSVPGVTGKGVGIALMDTGVDATHPDLKFDSTQTRAADAVVYDNWKMVSIASVRTANTDSTHGHGTHVAGIMVGQQTLAGQAAGAGPTQKGIAPGAKLYAWGTGEHTTLLWLSQAYDDLLYRLATVQDNPPIRVVQNSWSTGTDYNPNLLLNQQIASVVDHGVTVVFSAANNGGSGSENKVSAQCQIPREGIICVGGVEDGEQGDRDGAVLYFASSRGQSDVPETWPDLVAPATHIRSTKPLAGTLGDDIGSYYGTMSGTSVSAPMVSATIALMFEVNPELVPAQVEYILEQTAYKMSVGGSYAVSDDYRYNGSHYAKGHGLLDVKAAVEAAANS